MKSAVFNGLLMTMAVAAAYLQIRALPDLDPAPPATVALHYRPVQLETAEGPLKLAGAWELSAQDRRLGGISALAQDGKQFLAVSDRGSVARFDPPAADRPQLWLADLRDGPGPWGEKWARDAESLARDPQGRGWWVGYEQNHSLYLYRPDFDRAVWHIALHQDAWSDNRGAEGLLADRDGLLVAAENGRDALAVRRASVVRLPMIAGADVADAARAPDGSAWLLLRSKGLHGISQSIAPLLRDGEGYRTGTAWPVPKGAFDNYEGMAIEPLPNGAWRFWLITDDGHRFFARTLLAALDLPSQPQTQKARRPAPGSRNQTGKKP